MRGQMMDFPLLIPSLLDHAAKFHADTEIVSRNTEGGIHRYTYADSAVRAKKVASALSKAGVKKHQRVATLAWNNYRHFELYYGVSGMGGVMHTINPRLHPTQAAWIINNAEDQILFFDTTFAPIVKAIAASCPTVKSWVAMTDKANTPKLEGVDVVCYEDFIADGDENFEWAEMDEKDAACLCYTSGTTGNPKGVLYSHRSLMLHTFGACLPDVFNLTARDVVLPVVPMFHVNAWSIPYIGAMVGVKLVFPGPGLDGASLVGLFEGEKVTMSAGVPTVWLGVLNELRKNGKAPEALKRMAVGGSAVPPSMVEAYEKEFGITLEHAWGMTEMSPLGTYYAPKEKHLSMSAEKQFALKLKQGRPPYGVQMKIVNESGNEQPWDDKATGDLYVRGPWIVERYYGKNETALSADGWFHTGDVAAIDADGYLRITDRSKDLIKSGGEWISSIEVENIAMSLPQIAMAAVIAAKHKKWDERPLLIVSLKPDQTIEKSAILAHFEGKLAKFEIPDDVIIVDALPLGATGKVQKMTLREEYGDYLLNK